MMGANRSQGWYVFLFVLGFTAFPAGVLGIEGGRFGVGAISAVLGAGMWVVSLTGFRRIRSLEFTNGKQ